ncbi:hypothetical protein FOH10_32965 [Nocardia otitidiscaviarum]|uniref:PRC-barrel domain containing protein n=1 Tax=Nocardia otitidiscaviarum TaxID=1823 RepID=A0A516NVA3_9NOCA|nr:hypothetical protein [Nocardia otitidiscaviarum]MCP9622267.1 hypothetical protein [Nocardia otitidiscaviarum]QDP82818.1 hypothetical protein FOH10_32965 [Nocardia otitidiscaviarum]
MRARDLLGSQIRDPDGRNGVVLDIRARPAADGAGLTIAGLVIGRHRIRLFGYDRRAETGPALFRWLTRRIHRSTRYADLDDVDLQPDNLTLRVPWHTLAAPHEVDG